jgi:hypothetical protein
MNIKTGPIPEEVGKEINLANDFLEFNKAVKVVNTAEQLISQVGRFSRRAARTYRANQKKVKAEIAKRDEPFNLPSPIEQVIMVLKGTIKDTRAARDWKGFEKLRTYYTNIHQAMQRVKDKVSSRGWQVFEAIWLGVQPGSEVERLKGALRQRIRSLKRGLKSKNIYNPQEFIRQRCRKYIAGKKPPKPTPPKPVPPKPPKVSPFSWGVRLWTGYGDAVSGKNDTGLIQNRGGSLAAGASLEYKISQSLRLHFDYDFFASHDFGRDNLVLNDDLVMFSVVGSSYFVQAGFRHYRNDRPTLVRPNQDTFILSGGKRFMPKENLSIDLAGTFQIGSADYSSSHLQSKILGSAGVTYRSGNFVISPALVGGAILEEGAKQGIVGGELRAGLDLGRFGLNLKSYGMGYPGERSHIGWLLQGSFSFAKNWNILLSAGPGEFASGGEESTLSFHGGLGIAYGTSSAGPKPLLFEPLHYLMGSNRYGRK